MPFGALAALAGPLFQTAGQLVGGRQARRGLRDAEAMAAFNPFDVTSGIGSASFEGGSARTTLDPRFQDLSTSLLERAGSFLGQPISNLGGVGQTAAEGSQGFLSQLQAFDPFAAAETQFNRLEQILNPARETARSGLEARLLRQGRLGANAGGMGSPEMLAFNEAIDRSRRQGLFDAFTQAQQTQQNLLGLGTGLFNIAGGANEAIQQGGLGALQGAFGLESAPLDLARLGGNLGSERATAGARAGQFRAQRGQNLGQTISGFGSGLFGGGQLFS